MQYKSIPGLFLITFRRASKAISTFVKRVWLVSVLTPLAAKVIKEYRYWACELKKSKSSNVKCLGFYMKKFKRKTAFKKQV